METKRNSGEVDIFELFKFIGKAFNKLGNILLRFFNFLIRNVIVIGILVVVGFFAGFLLDKNAPEKQKTQAIIVSNFESAGYIYESIQNMNIKFTDLDEDFLKKLNVDEDAAGQISLQIEPIIEVRELSEEEQAYWELLEENETLSNDEKQAILDRSYRKHKITLFHTEDIQGKVLLERIIQQLRKNRHYEELYAENKIYLQRHIAGNLFTLAQIDTLFKTYSKTLGQLGTLDGNLIYSENSFNLAGLLNSKMELQKETADLIVENVENSNFVKVVHLGNPTGLETESFLSNKTLVLPLFLVILFLMAHVFLRIYRKSRQLNE